MRVVVCRLGTSRGDAWSEHRVKGGFKRLHAPGGAVSMETTMFKIKVTAETDVVIGVRRGLLCAVSGWVWGDVCGHSPQKHGGQSCSSN